MHTFKETGGKINARVSVPKIPSAALDHIRNALGIELFKSYQSAICSPEANDDFRHTEQKRLYPEFHELSLELDLVTLVIDFSRGLQLDPTDR